MKRISHYFSTLLFLLIACNSFAGSPTSLTSISLAPNPQQDVCAGSDILVQFLVNDDANAGNVFTVQLSDATGSFANPVTIGSIASVTSSSFNATIPLSTLPGIGYHIRVVSSSPVVTSNDGPELNISGLPTVSITGSGAGPAGPNTFCVPGFLTITSSATGTGLAYQWKQNGVEINGATAATYTTQDPGNFSLVVATSVGCIKESNILTVTGVFAPQGEITGSHTVCPGHISMLTGSGTLAGTWFLNGNQIGNVFTNSIGISVPGNYQWRTHTLSGCDGPISAIFTVTATTTTFTGLASNYASNAPTVTLVGDPAGGTFSGPGITGNTFEPSIAGVGGPYTITYTYSDQFMFCTVSSSQQTNVTSGCTAPAATITAAGSTTFCDGGSVLLNANTGTGLSYQWQIGGVNIAGATSSFFVTSASGSHTVVVTNATACSATSSAIIITVNPLPTASIILAGGATTFCSGGSVLLSGNTTSGTWSVGGGTTATLTATSTGDYFTTTTNGCGSATSNHIAVTATANLTPSVTISANPGNTICAGTSVTFTATPVNGGTPPAINWMKNGVSISGGSQLGLTSFTYSLFNNGDEIRCDMTVNPNAGACISPGVVTSNIIAITVNPLPVAQITASGPTTFCGNSNVTLNANTGTGLSYQWQIGTVNITGATSSSFVASVSGSYTVIVTNANGCSATSAAVVVTSNPLPSVSFSGLANIYATNAPAATLTGDPAGGTFSGPGISGNIFDPSIAGAGGPYTITYTYTNANGCTNTSTHQTNVGSACPLPSIPGSIATTSDGTSVCPGDTRTYTIPAVAAATYYTWTAPPGADIIGGQGTVLVIVAYNAGFTGDSLRVTANNNCGSSIARARKINRKAAPSSPVAISGPTTGICNMTGILYSVIQEGSNTYNWSWNTGGVSIVGGQGTSEITSDFTTSYISGKISVTASNSCGTSTPRNLIVDAKAGTPGTISGISGICANQQAVAYSIASVTSATSYIWYAPTGAHINDGTTTSTGTTLATAATNVQVNFGSTGGLVRVKAVNACTVGTVVSLPLSIVCKNGLPATEIATEQAGNVYPNPSNGHFRITVPVVSKITATAKIEIVNQFGQMVYQSNQPCSNGIIDLNLTGKFANGIYMVNCIINGEKTVSKLMISK
ncbi:MAG: T9SS type A sorting domain-containing protein [Ferruginibacter sp.]